MVDVSLPFVEALFDIELVCVGVDVWVEDGGVEHHARAVPVGVVLGQADLEPKDSALVGSLADEENAIPGQGRGVGGDAVDSW